MRGQQAELRGDWADAAQLYALADQIAPSPEALRSAARAARQAGLSATAATHAALLLTRTPVSAESRTLAEEILRASEHDLARIEARCARACRVTLDGRLIPGRAATEHVVYARPGDRHLRASFGPGANGEERSVALRAGETSVVELGAPVAAVAAVTPPAHDDGLSPWFFGGGLLLTAVAGGLSIWSGIDVMNAHASYDRSAPDAQMAYQHGRDLEARTDVLFAITGALALTTVILAIFTDWDGSPAVDHARLRDLPLASVGDGGFSLGWRHVLD
jgi:hypothetical protein